MKQRLQHLTQQRGYSHWPLLTTFAAAAVTWLFLMNPATANQITGASMQDSERSTPTPIVRVEPRYPLEAARGGIEGVVQLRFDIAADGSTENIWVEISQSKEIFHDAAVEALKRWRFHPDDAGTDYRVAMSFELE